MPATTPSFSAALVPLSHRVKRRKRPGLHCKKAEVPTIVIQPLRMGISPAPDNEGDEMPDVSQAHIRRRNRFAILARCDFEDLQKGFRTLRLDPEVHFLRPVETGLVMLRGRAGGTGAAFNIGEATVTRASVKLGDGRIGHSVALGRDRKRATLAAVIDALASDADDEIRVEEAIIAPLRNALSETDRRDAERVAGTRVDFFTMVRGEDE